MFPTDTTVVLVRTFTQAVCLYTIASTTADYGFRLVKKGMM
jgi:hypothetical protein